ncbi:MAG: phosphoribosyl-ATP diphosphatase [Burkholderiaceae bacterium]|nr:phosphoribosyl-ATP diphosphatase [Burkholderiaceae bacterium]
MTREPTQVDVLDRLAAVIASRKRADPATSYVARLFADGPDAVLKKIGEEATETVMAAKDGVAPRIVAETADLWFHCIVMLAQHGLTPADVLDELARREGLSGLAEKAGRASSSPDAGPAPARRDEDSRRNGK